MRPMLLATASLIVLVPLSAGVGGALHVPPTLNDTNSVLDRVQGVAHGTALPEACAIRFAEALGQQGLNCGSLSGQRYTTLCDGTDRCVVTIEAQGVAARWVQEGGMTLRVESPFCSTDDDQSWIVGAGVGPVEAYATCSRALTVRPGDCVRGTVEVSLSFRGDIAPPPQAADPFELDIGNC